VRIAFAGSPAPAAVILRDLADARHEIALVISQPDRPRGRSRTPSPTPVAAAADELGIPCIRTPSINADDVLERLRAADVGALCVVAFGQLLKEPLLSEWPCINAHFSLLPAYRGAAPVERALMDGVTETGVCIMRMDAGLDTGPVARQVPVPVGPDDDTGVLLDLLCAAATPSLVDALDALESGTLVVTPQPGEGASLAPKLTDADRELDPGRSAAELANRVRALSPHIGARLVIDGTPFKIWRAHARAEQSAAGLRVDGGRLVLGCVDGALEIVELQPPSRGRVSAAEFLRGYRGPLVIA
jgi:methionyl-tRNA formyltransferase